MAAPEYKVITVKTSNLEVELNAQAQDGWRPRLISPETFGGASFVNSGPARVDSYCVILERT